MRCRLEIGWGPAVQSRIIGCFLAPHVWHCCQHTAGASFEFRVVSRVGRRDGGARNSRKMVHYSTCTRVACICRWCGSHKRFFHPRAQRDLFTGTQGGVPGQRHPARTEVSGRLGRQVQSWPTLPHRPWPSQPDRRHARVDHPQHHARALRMPRSPKACNCAASRRQRLESSTPSPLSCTACIPSLGHTRPTARCLRSRPCSCAHRGASTAAAALERSRIRCGNRPRAAV